MRAVTVFIPRHECATASRQGAMFAFAQTPDESAPDTFSYVDARDGRS